MQIFLVIELISQGMNKYIAFSLVGWRQGPGHDRQFPENLHFGQAKSLKYGF